MTAYEHWEQQLDYLRAINLSIQLGPAEPIDYFAQAEGWLVQFQGLQSVLLLMCSGRAP